jgi:plasmid stabilization system protein ParE
MTIVWKALARRDMQEIFAHIARYAGPANGYEALADIHVQINALADQPALGRAGPKPGTRYLIVRRHDVTYRATYRVRGQKVIILRVRDTRQRGA